MITHKRVKMIVKIFPPDQDSYVKSFVTYSLDNCKDKLEQYLEHCTTPGTRVIHINTHYVPHNVGEDV
jgi:hypothetical protein